MLELDNGKQLFQSTAIMRYIAGEFVTPTGGFLYPGRKDADLSYRINAIMDRNEELYPTYRQFLVPIAPDYKNRETHLKTFIDVHFPQYLKELE